MCFGRKHGDPSRSIKSHWATLRTLSNGEKVPRTLPLLVTNEVITKFEAMANICNIITPANALQSIIIAYFLRL